jgi:hypothetical protein
MGCIISKGTAVDYYRNYSDYYSAGLHFTDGKTIIAGAQPHKIIPYVSGFGGRKEDEDGDNSIITAYRETVEELMGVKLKPAFIYQMINALGIIPLFQREADKYVYYVLDYESLVFIAEYIYSHHESMYYRRPPTSVNDIINGRWTPAHAEVSQLYKINMDSEIEIIGLPLDTGFKSDIKEIVKSFAEGKN